VDHHGIDAHGLHQHHVLREIEGEFGIAHGMAAILDHESAPGIALQVGQGLDQGFGLGEHGGIAGGVLSHIPPLAARRAI